MRQTWSCVNAFSDIMIIFPFEWRSRFAWRNTQPSNRIVVTRMFTIRFLEGSFVFLHRWREREEDGGRRERDARPNSYATLHCRAQVKPQSASASVPWLEWMRQRTGRMRRQALQESGLASACLTYQIRPHSRLFVWRNSVNKFSESLLPLSFVNLGYTGSWRPRHVTQNGHLILSHSESF